jgi:hypothetical protein
MEPQQQKTTRDLTKTKTKTTKTKTKTPKTDQGDENSWKTQLEEMEEKSKLAGESVFSLVSALQLTLPLSFCPLTAEASATTSSASGGIKLARITVEGDALDGGLNMDGVDTSETEDDDEDDFDESVWGYVEKKSPKEKDSKLIENKTNNNNNHHNKKNNELKTLSSSSSSSSSSLSDATDLKILSSSTSSSSSSSSSSSIKSHMAKSVRKGDKEDSIEAVDDLGQEPQEGNIEYKLKLVGKDQNRLNNLTTQMAWRLKEGRGEAIYELGVEDNGNPRG